MVGNDSSPHLKMFGEVSKPLTAEMSEILISWLKSRNCSNTLILHKNTNLAIFAIYQLSCFIQCRQSV